MVRGFANQGPDSKRDVDLASMNSYMHERMHVYTHIMRQRTPDARNNIHTSNGRNDAQTKTCMNIKANQIAWTQR